MTKIKINEIGNFKAVARFLDSYSSYNTKKSYQAHIKNFFDFIEKNPDKYIKDVRLMEKKEKLHTMDGYEDDIIAFNNHLKSKRTPPRSIISTILTIKVFFRKNRIVFDETIWMDLMNNGTGFETVTKETPITREILKKLLEFADLKGKTYFLCLASSGCRYDELLHITFDDIDLNSKPVKITLKPEYTKKKKSRITFISREAAKYLTAWLKERNNYLRIACERVNNKKKGGIQCWHGTITKSIDDNRIFPFSTSTARFMWDRLLKKSGFTEKDKTTSRYTVRIHGTRKFFESNFQRSESPRKTVAKDFLIGHKNGMETTYSQFASGELENEYLMAEKYLTIFELEDREEQFEAEVERRLETRTQEIKESVIKDIWKQFANEKEFKRPQPTL